MKNVSDEKALDLNYASKQAEHAVGSDAFDSMNDVDTWRADIEDFLSTLSKGKIAHFADLMERALKAKTRNSFKE